MRVQQILLLGIFVTWMLRPRCPSCSECPNVVKLNKSVLSRSVGSLIGRAGPALCWERRPGLDHS